MASTSGTIEFRVRYTKSIKRIEFSGIAMQIDGLKRAIANKLIIDASQIELRDATLRT